MFFLFQQSGIAPLHIAVALPDETGVEITKLLLKSGADPDIKDTAFDSEDNGRTPAHIACSREDDDKVSQSPCDGCLETSDFRPQTLKTQTSKLQTP